MRLAVAMLLLGGCLAKTTRSGSDEVPVAHVAISPTTATIATGGTQDFVATVTGTPATAVTWAVTGGTANGVVVATGASTAEYTAPGVAGTYSVVVSVQADPSVFDTATVTVTGDPVVVVAVAPNPVTLAGGGRQQFSATVTGTTDTVVTWSLQEPSGCGTISSTGLYDAPNAVVTCHVVATSRADPARSDVATVTVTGNSSGIYELPPDRMTRWQPGVTHNGGFPAGRTQCGSTFAAGATRAQLQNALDTCPDNTFVLLGPGTFSVGAGLTIGRSNITLRGSGAGQTILSASGSAAVPVFVGNWSGVPNGWMGWRSLTADAVKGAYSVTVGSTTGLTVGELVHINEQYDPSLAYYNPRGPQGDCSPLQQLDYLGWGECRCVRADCVPSGCTARTNVAAAQAESRPVGQAMEIAAISGNTVTFTTPFHWTFRVNHNARIARLGSGSSLEPAVKNVGVEHLTVQNGNGGDGWGNIYFAGTVRCWARNIESNHTISGGSLVIGGGLQNEIRDSYLHSATDPNPGGAGYGFVVDSYASDNLFENNIVWSFNKVMSMRSSGGGNVIAYSYFEDGYGQGYPTIQEVGINASHMTGAHMELFEGNQGFNFDSDSYWGSQFNIVVFRNHFTSSRRNMPGNLAALSDRSNRRAVGLTSFQRNYSFVGNVLGYPNNYLQAPVVGHAYPATFSGAPQGTTLRYEWTGGDFGPDASPSYTPMWQLGYDGSGYDCTGGWGPVPDTITVSSTLRDGNFDFVTNAVHWHGIGGSGVGQTTPPAAFALRNSLYLSARPAFFGNAAWPWVDGGSAATPLPGALPARARFDLGTPNAVP